MKRSLFGCALIILLLIVVPAALGQDRSTPPQSAEQIRQRLFDAQIALLGGQAEQATEALSAARDLYASDLQAALRDGDPDLDARIALSFEQAAAYSATGNVSGFAVERGRIWTSLLAASAHVVQASIQADQVAQARLWLPLREFRPATRFSRPSTDATLALLRVEQGGLDRETAWTLINADLLDTYQFQLGAALSAADDAHARGFAIRRAEESGLAAGYFSILLPVFSAEQGADSAQSTAAHIAALVQAAATNDGDAYVAARAQIDAALAGFRAVAISEADLIRRAGQFNRFLPLIAIEYSRGVRAGVVVNDIEIQEALTFVEGVTAAFADLETTFSQNNAQAAQQMGERLAALPDQIHQVIPVEEMDATIAEIQRLAGQVIPAAWLTPNPGSDIDVVLTVLDQINTAVDAKDYVAAESSRLEAYALLELGTEQRLMGFAPELAAQIESLFWQGSSRDPGLGLLLANQAPADDIRAALTQLEIALDKTRAILADEQSAATAVASNAAIIVFREGMEAVLILASLVASLRTLEQRQYRRPIIIGALLAGVATVLTWLAATNLLYLLLPLGERLEALVSLVSIGVLLLITNWFFHKTYWTGWLASFHSRKRQIIGSVMAIQIGQMLGLVLLGFTSIYREGFETVLFLQALVLDAGVTVVLQGVALGLVGTALLGVLTFTLQVRLPYKKMLIVTGIMIGMVLLTMVGKTVHIMQAVGWMPMTPISGVYPPAWMGQWFGLFATWQGIVLQAAAAVFVIGSYFLAEHQNKHQHRHTRSVAN
jgi:high-affinity iron transporter